MARTRIQSLALLSSLALSLSLGACKPEPEQVVTPEDTQETKQEPELSDKERTAQEAAAKRAMLEALPPLPGIEKSKPVEFPDPVISTLDNGLRLVVLEDHETPRVSAQLLVGAGDIYAPADNTMLASLCASALTEGTTKTKKAKLDEAIDDTGGSLGASAGDELASISASMLSGDLGVALKIIAEQAQFPAFEDESLTKVKDAMILGLRSEKANVQALAFRMAQRVLYGDSSPYGRPFATEEAITAITAEQVRAFHQAHYLPNNATLLVVGDVDAAAVAKLAKKHFGKWQKGAEVAVPRSQSVPSLDEPTVHIIDRSGSVQATIMVVMRAPKIGDQGWLETQLLNQVLSGGTLTTRLNLVLREQLGLTYGAYSAHFHGYDGGALIGGGGTKNSSAGEFATALIDLMYGFGEQPVGASELERIKALVSGRFALESEGAGFTAAKTQERLLYDLPEDFWSNYRVEIDKLTPEQLLSVGQTVMDRGSLQLIAIGRAKALQSKLEDFGTVKIYNTDLEPQG